MSKRVKVENLEQGKVRLTISVSAEEFDNALDKAFEKVVKEVKVDGFRPGKMPKNVFIKRFGWEALYSDALDIVLQETYPVAIHESKVIPVSEPSIDLDFKSLSKGKGFKYTADLEIWEKSELGQYKGLAVKKGAVKVTAAQVKEYINHALASKQETVIKETPAQKGDTVVIDFEGFIDGVAFEGGKGENYPLELGSNSFIPGFEDQLIGSKPETELDVNVVFPENYHEHLASKPATFKVKVHEVKGKITPKLTDELVAELEIPNVHTVAEYKQYVLDLLTKEETNRVENEFMEKLFAKIAAGSKINVPNAIVEQELAKHIASVEEQAKHYGVPTEVLLQYSGYESLDAFKEEGRKNLKVRITNDIIIEEVIKAEKIKVAAKEIEARYNLIAEGDQEKLKELKTKYSTEQVADQIKYEKAIELIKNSVVETKTCRKTTKKAE